MNVNVIASIAQLTPTWLTTTLQRDGELTQGIVTDIRSTQAGEDVFNSSVYFLRLTYSHDAPVSAPRRLVLKLNQHEDGEAEVAFYQLAAPHAQSLPTLTQCYDAMYDVDSGNSHLLLQDVSETHVTPVTRSQVLALDGVPSEAHLHNIVDALAQFHAFWWERPELGKGVAAVRWWYTNEDYYEQHIERRRNEFASFIQRVGDEFPDNLRLLYEHALAQLPGLWERYLAPRVLPLKQITMSGGDSYFAQFLCPRQEGAGQHTYMIDFQDASANFPAYDLVYLFACFWTPEQRHGREEALFRRYLAGLHQYGVRNYDWEQLWLDYRIMIALMMFDPIWNQTSGSPRSYWWPKLCCLTDAYRELGCEKL